MSYSARLCNRLDQEIGLPALDLAEQIKNGERSARRPRDLLLVGGILVLAAELEAVLLLLDAEREETKKAREYVAALIDEADAAAVDRANGHLRLRNRTGVAK